MTQYKKPLAIATALLALPFFALAQNSGMQNGQNSNGMNSSQTMSAQPPGQREAARMVPANAALLKTLDAKDIHPGASFKARLSKEATLSDGTKLPSGTMLLGSIASDDMQVQGTSKLALCFTEAKLKDGKVIPIKATIVGMAPPDSSAEYPETPGNQVPNSWNDGTLQVDQINVVKGVDLHSRISSKNSGVFVSNTKDNVKLNSGSEMELAIAAQGSPGTNGNNAAAANNGSAPGNY